MLHKNIKVLTLFNFFLDFRLFAPIAVIYFQQVTGSYTLALSVFSVVFLSTAFFEIPTGVLSDRIGRKKTLIFGSIATFIGLILYALGGSPIFLYIGAMFEGIGRSLYSGNNEALLHATLKETNQHHEYDDYLGKTSSVFQIASAGAAVVGGIIASQSFPLVMWLSIVPQLVCIVLAFQIKEPKVEIHESGNVYEHLLSSIKNVVRNRKLRLLSVANMINHGMGDASYEFQAAFYALLWPTWLLGVARTISNIVATASFYFAGKLIRRFSAISLLLTEGVVSPLTKLFALLVITPLSPALMALMSVLYGVGNVAGNSLRQKEFNDTQRATMESVVSFGGSIFYALSAFVLGMIADNYSIVMALIVAQLVLFSTNFFYLKVYRIKV